MIDAAIIALLILIVGGSFVAALAMIWKLPSD